MTDKQIMIDGVDVSGCDCFIEQMDFPNNLEGGYYNQNNLCECGIQGVESYPFFCKDNPDCYYKQLKAKEQECERLEKQKNILLGQLVINDGEDVTVQISQSQFEEYNQLEAENDELKKRLTILDDEDVVVEITVKQFEEYKKLKETLTEIKEIAEGVKGYDPLAKQILQKISECEVNNELYSSLL